MNADNLIKLENNLALLYGRESTPTIEKLKPNIEKWKEKKLFSSEYDAILINSCSKLEQMAASSSSR